MARKRYSAKPKAAIIIFIIVIAYAISFSVMLLFRPSTAIYEVVAGGLTQTYTCLLYTSMRYFKETYGAKICDLKDLIVSLR